MKKLRTCLFTLSLLFVFYHKASSQTIIAGHQHSYFFCPDGSVMAAGENGHGTLGIGPTPDQPVPVLITSVTDIKSVAAGGAFVLFLKNDGTVWGAGYNEYSQLGPGPTTVPYPIQLANLSGITFVAAGGNRSYFIKSDSTVWSMGTDYYHQYGQSGGFSLEPEQVPGLTKVIAVATAGGAGFFLKSDSTVWAHGGNFNGTLGTGSTAPYINIPEKLVNLTGVVSIKNGLFLKSDGTAWCVGLNFNSPPTQFSNFTDITAIAAGTSVALLRSDSTLWTWGNNNFGQLGNGTFFTNNFTDPQEPYQVPVTGVIEVSTHGDHVLFKLSDSTVWGFGNGYRGELANNGFDAYNTPVPTVGVCSPFLQSNTPLEKQKALIYPNPSNGIFTLTSEIKESESTQIEVFNVWGEKVFSKQITQPATLLDLNNQPIGFYFYCLKTGSQTTSAGKLIIE